MRASHIKIQQTTVITINGKKNPEDVLKEIRGRINKNINQVSIFNSAIDLAHLPEMQGSIEVLSIRKTAIHGHIQGIIFGANLRVLELPFCNLSFVPKIVSKLLSKLNVSHNNISQISLIPCSQTLRILDLRDNKLIKVSQSIFDLPNLTVLHEFISKKSDSISNMEQNNQMIDIRALLEVDIVTWSNEKLIEVCQDILQNDNSYLIQQILPYLDEQFIKIIFSICLKRNKHCILQLLISQQKMESLGLQERVMLLLPAVLPIQILKMVPLQWLVQSISKISKDVGKINRFFGHLEQECKGENLFIQSEKDLINFMNLSVKYPHQFEGTFLRSQYLFFQSYDFSNKGVVRYLLQLDDVTLVKLFLQNKQFKERIFVIQSFKSMIKPNRKMYKMLHKARKELMKQSSQNCSAWYYPEYRQRKTFCLKNDLYDYEILGQYEQMQCSYMKKDFRYTLKFYNKENEISLAKKIENSLKRSSIKGLKNNLSFRSTCSSFVG